MLTPRGIAVALAGVGMWVAARILGSPGLETVAIGLLLLPFIAGAFVRWGTRTIHVQRHLSEPRVAPGTRVTVRLDVTHEGPAKPSFLLLEDRLPPVLGRPARVVVAGSARALQRVSYTIVPHARGRYVIGPMAVDRTDAFGLTRRRVLLDGRDELLVTPEVEDLRAPAESTSVTNIGSARARQLLRTGEEYYTMRGYEEGDDLRRIHWPSVARTGELLERRLVADLDSAPLVVLDAAQPASGEALDAAVRAAASLCLELARSGGCALLLPGERRPVSIAPDLGAWPYLHARLALVEPGPAVAPAGRAPRMGGIFWVTAAASRRPPRALERLAAGARYLVSPVPLPGYRTAFTVAGCSGQPLDRSAGRSRTRAAA